MKLMEGMKECRRILHTLYGRLPPMMAFASASASSAALVWGSEMDGDHSTKAAPGSGSINWIFGYGILDGANRLLARLDNGKIVSSNPVSESGSTVEGNLWILLFINGTFQEKCNPLNPSNKEEDNRKCCK